MCSSCKDDHGRWWSSTHVVLLAFVVTLVLFSAAGLVVRARSSDPQALQPCAAAADAANRYGATVTRDLRDHRALHVDTAGFVAELRSLGGRSCPGTRDFLRSAEVSVGSLCRDCADELRSASRPDAGGNGS